MAKVRFDKLIDAWDPVLRKAFLDAIAKVTDQAQIEQIAKALQEGSIENAMKAVGIDPVLFRSFDKAILSAFEAGGDATAANFPVLGTPGELRTVFQFNIRNPAAEQWIKDYSSTLITEVVDDQRNMVRDFLQKGLAAGNNPRTTALELVGRIAANGKRQGGMIGLTTSQSQWVQNYANALASDSPKDALTYSLRDRRFDASVIRADDAGEALSADAIDAMTTSYRNRALMYRAETIARTESMTALHEAQQQALDQAVDGGAVKKENVKLTWRTSHDKRVRESHRAMEGQTISMGEMFVTGLGNELAYPGDPNGPAEDTIQCRCWVEESIDFYADLT